MEKTPKEMLKAYVDSQKFNSTTEIMNAMKEMLVFPGRKAAFTLRVHTVFLPGTQVGKPG